MVHYASTRTLQKNARKKAGEVPLPPYISRPEGPTIEDTSDYQTIFARRPGAVAAPTASLHFTEALLQKLSDKGVGIDVVRREGRSDDIIIKQSGQDEMRQGARYIDEVRRDATT